jgi:glycosyltransferase involved in cell wall biosynthesis
VSRLVDLIVPARLLWKDEVPFSVAFDDVYFSRESGLDEALHVFIQGNELIQRWQANKRLSPKLNVHFIVMGAGDIQSIFDKLAPDDYLLKNIHFVGHLVPQMVSDILNISHLGVMPSRSEGFGIACLEAMGCGLPMVVTRCGGPEHFAVGEIINVGDYENLAEKITDLITLSPTDYQLLSQKALEAAQGFSWSQIANERLLLY